MQGGFSWALGLTEKLFLASGKKRVWQLCNDTLLLFIVQQLTEEFSSVTFMRHLFSYIIKLNLFLQES
jgi:hypothetical protein